MGNSSNPSVTFLLGNLPTRAVVPNEEFAAGIRERTEGFHLPESSEIDLDVEIELNSDIGFVSEVAQAHSDGPGISTIELPFLRGTLHVCKNSGLTAKARAETSEIVSVYNFLNIVLSLIVPEEGAILLHADAVEINGKAYVFSGKSGSGKSTSAQKLVREKGAGLLAVDRALIVNSSNGIGPYLVPLPRLGRKEKLGQRPSRVPIKAIIFPRKAEDLCSENLHPLDGVQSILKSVIVPQGQGLPVKEILDISTELFAKLPVVELGFALDQDLGKSVQMIGNSV